MIKHYDDEVELVPLDGALCTVNNVCVGETTKLSQGACFQYYVLLIILYVQNLNMVLFHVY